MDPMGAKSKRFSWLIITKFMFPIFSDFGLPSMIFSWIYQPYLTYNLRNFNIDTQNCHCWKEIHFPRPIIFEYLYVMFRGCFTVISKGCGIVISPKSWEYIQVEACVPFMGGEITQPQNPKKKKIPRSPIKQQGVRCCDVHVPCWGGLKIITTLKGAPKMMGFLHLLLYHPSCFFRWIEGPKFPSI